ncbi:MAG TPA: N-acetylornithine carbamoyltransferase, partial [Planctomycetota bacterium]|nr:N-acetylornithine carbamoyltransferase [Planctomycetota bacterium]
MSETSSQPGAVPRPARRKRGASPAAGAAAQAGPGMGHLLSLRDLSQAEWNALLARAEALAGPDGRRPLLAGRRFGMLLFNPSLRTRTAFEVACYDLGAHAVALEAGQDTWSFEHRAGVVMDGAAAEHVVEAAGVLGRLLDGLGVRAFAGLADAAEDAREPLLTAIAAASPVPVLNLESAMDHPHQGLADALTLRRALRGQHEKVVLSWAPHVKPLPLAVPHAALLAFAREGHEVVLAHPPGYELDEGVLAAARAGSAEAGGSLSVTHDRREALSGARVVYAKSWGSRGHYGDPAAASAGFARHRDWMLTAADLGA